ncbi:unnamed protein product [Cylindrotheca closterium]|uniref:DUF3592 domain-containing protein n=1 Tax=Cylindrotheca closterium TaxID=2856 RepID=A0AAD2FTM5_9STRA|nr:unnamed protein product [Cylindrotheca closterium]
MRQTPYSQNNQRRQRNGNYTPFRTSGSLITSTAAAVCCLCIMIAAIAGWRYSDSYFESYVKTTATIVGVEEQVEVEDDGDNTIEYTTEYCPKIQFFTVGEDPARNITTIMDTACDEDVDDFVLGDSVDIRYDPSDPTDVVEAIIPEIIEAAVIGTIAITLICAGCYVLIGIHFYKATKGSDNSSSNIQEQHAYSNNNNSQHSTPSSIPMTNLGVNDTEYNNPYGYSNNNNTYANSEPVGNTYTSSQPVETTASAVIVSPNETQVGSSPSMASAYPEGTTANTGIAAGEEAPPIVGCVLVDDNNNAASSSGGVSQQSYPRSGGSNTYVSPSDLPLNPVVPTSSYVSPSDIREAMATVDRPYR